MSKSFVSVLGIGKGTWGHVARIIADETFDRIVLVSNEWGRENFKPPKPCEWVIVNNRQGFEMLKDEIKAKIPEGEIALSLASGSGKEHMAILAALREKGSEFKVVTLTGNGLKYY